MSVSSVPSVSPEAGEHRPKIAFTGEYAPESRAALAAVRDVLAKIAAGQMQERSRRQRVQESFEAAVAAVLCEAAVDFLEWKGRGFRCTRSKRVLERPIRNRPKAINTQLPGALDALCARDLIAQYKGFIDAGTGERWQTAVWPGPALRDLISAYGLGRGDFRCDAPGDEIALTDREGNAIQYVDSAATKLLRQQVQAINEALREADIRIVPTAKIAPNS